MIHYWELQFFAIVGLCVVAYVVVEVLRAWRAYRRKWKTVPRYYGRPYDASVDSKVRPNVRRA